MSDLRIKFGKYSGKTIEEIYNLDARYCQWLKRLPNALNPEQSKWLKDNEQEVEYAIPFGKYKGKSLKSIADSDPNYLAWLSRSMFAENNSEFADKIRELMGNGIAPSA